MIKDEKRNDNKDNKLYCDFTFCIYNSACCGTPAESKIKECHCKKSNIASVVGFDKIEDLCTSFIWDNDKKGKCVDCQLEEYGEVSIPLLNIDISAETIIEDIEDDYI